MKSTFQSDDYITNSLQDIKGKIKQKFARTSIFES